jgi:multicomponent K+:H+ antiporter subunit G
MSDIPVWIAVLVGLLSIAGALLTLLGCIGLAQFESFYERVHAPTLGTRYGAVFILLASAIFFSVSGQRLAMHEALIFVFVSVTTPVTLMLLARAALYRDRAERNGAVPPANGQDVRANESPSDKGI